MIVNMKTAEEILNDFVDDSYELSIKNAIEAMKIYANAKLDEAAEKAKINIWRNYPNVHSLDVQSLTTHNDLGKDVLFVSKQSILSLKDKI